MSTNLGNIPKRRRYMRITELHRLSLRISGEAETVVKDDPETAALMEGFAWGLWKMAELRCQQI